MAGAAGACREHYLEHDERQDRQQNDEEETDNHLVSCNPPSDLPDHCPN